MAIIRITTTRQRDLQPLGTAGQTAIESWSVLSTLLARELSPAHAALLAEPVENAARGETDWYADGDTAPVPIAMADPETRASARAERARLEQDIRALATRKRTGAEGERFLGEMLMLALSVPAEDHVYVLNGHPVLVAWGHAPAGAAPEQVALTGYRRGAPVPMTILPPPRLPVSLDRVRRWLLPALLASLLLPLCVLLLLFFDPFGWYAIGGPRCTVAEGQPELLAALQAATDREAALRSELAQMAEDAGRRHLQCPPVRIQEPTPGPTPTPSTDPSVPAQVPALTPGTAPGDTPPRSADVERATKRGAHSGKLQIVLAWEDRNDLDLHVFCPDGGHISFGNKTASGGRIDVDANGHSATANTSPVESVFFDDPAPGTYRVVVNPYAMRDSPESPFRVTIRRDGEPDKVIRGTARNGAPDQVITEIVVAPR